MARYDKYDPISGGFRAMLGQAIVLDEDTPANNQVGVPLAVGLNAQGLLVVGAGTTGVVGIAVFDGPRNIGDIADVMTAGEIVDLDEDVFSPAQVIFGQSSGVVNATTGGTESGFIVGDRSATTGVVRSRLVVRMSSVGPTVA